MKYALLILLLPLAFSSCKKDETFSGFFGIDNDVVYTTNCTTRYYASYKDGSGAMNPQDFKTGSQSWDIKLKSGQKAELLFQSFGQPGTVSITVNNVVVASQNCDSKANVDISYVIP